MLRTIIFALAISSFYTFAFGCHGKSAAAVAAYTWQPVTTRAAYPPGYNYPVFIVNGEMRALHNGCWISKDGENWTKTALPESGLNSGYQRYVLFKEAVYSLGTMQGNYLNMKLSSRISRTRDFRHWELLTEKSNLPKRVFYGATVFKNKIWLIGGWDGRNYYNDVWNSADGVHWKRVAENTAWTPRTARVIVVFKNKIWLFGGGSIDGDKNANPDSEKEVWSSEDGLNWTPIKINSPGQLGGTPVVFDDKLWMVGANRNNGNFDSAVFVSEDGLNWQEQSAPWTPRGAVAVWAFGDRLFMTGGKYSYALPNGEIKFVYSNDVWAMRKKSE